MRNPKSVLTSLLALAAVQASCAGNPVRTYEDKDPRLEPGQTFRWLSPEDAASLRLGDPEIEYITSSIDVRRGQEVEERVRPLIEEGLKRKGYDEAGSEPPDLYVTFFARAADGSWVSSWNGKTQALDGIPVILSPDFDRRLVREFREGNVYLVIFNRLSRSSVWTGVENVSKQKTDLSHADVHSGIDRLMSSLRRRG